MESRSGNSSLIAERQKKTTTKYKHIDTHIYKHTYTK